MKLKFTFYALLLSFSIFAQTSDKGFSFQGFAIDPDGKALGSTSITVQFTISPSIGTGGTYIETHTPVSDPYGVFHCIIGKGTKGTGSIEFKYLDFTRKGTIYKLKVEVKKTSGGNFTTISDADFNAVPYARKAENGVPVGTIVAYGGDKNNVPDGWLLCDGASFLQSDFPQLYAAIGTAWGTTGSSFNVPDLRGMFLRGVNDVKAGNYADPNAGSRASSNPGGNTGNAVGTIQDDENKPHAHTGATNNDGAHAHSYTDQGFGGESNCWGNGSCSGSVYLGVQTSRGSSTANDGAHSHAFTTNNTGVEARPNNAYVYYIIKF